MLNVDRLLCVASGKQVEPCLTCPTSEKDKSDSGNLGAARPSLTCPTCPTEKTAVATIQDAGAERPLSLEPLPGRYWLDPVDNGFLPAYKTMLDRKECRGCPQACQRCRALMADLETCLLGPEGGAA